MRDTTKLKKRVQEERLKVSEYEKIIREKMRPQLVPLGNFLTFNDNILHGSVHNNDPLPRISFDFRIAIKPFEIGVKKIGIDYISDLFENKKGSIMDSESKKCKTIVSSSGKLAHLSHITQRKIISDFCISNNLISEMEASEFYTMDHYPQIMEWIALEQDKKEEERLPIVIASKSCFENNSKLIKMCQEGGIKLYDALGNNQLC